jgi:hypothetical protein
LNANDWNNYEEINKDLPCDYKELLSTMGSGVFGEIIFYSPEAEDGYYRLPEAEEYAKELLMMENVYNNGTLTGSESILGYIDNRRYIIYGNNTWLICGSDTGKIIEIGDNLPKFLYTAYMSLNKDGKLKTLAETIWTTGFDGQQRLPFFKSYK